MNKQWVGRVAKELKAKGKDFNLFKQNPLHYTKINRSYEQRIFNLYKDNKEFTWFNKSVTLKQLVQEFPENEYQEEIYKRYPEFRPDDDDIDNGNIIFFFCL